MDTRKTFSRREFVVKGTAVVGGLLTAGLPWAKVTAVEEERPNLLFILTDDQRYDAMGFMGRPSFLKTPNIDRLAREGAHFENAFVTTALCSPSRASFLTGTYAHIHSVVNNEANDPDPACPNFGQLLQKVGYETAYIGKWHMAPKSDPRPGFDYWLSFKAQGVYENPTLNENGNEFQVEGYMTDILTEYAVKWLSKERRKPFCMVLGHKAVHAPFTPAPRHRSAFPDAEIPEPASYKDTFADKPAWMRRGFTFGMRRERWVESLDKPVPKEVKRENWNPRAEGRINYYRTILAIDDSVGRILDALEKSGQLGNTVIVFAGDNGFFQGEHGLGDKRLIYEESIRIPLLIRYPKMVKPGTKVKEMVLNIDIAPTFLELAKAEKTSMMQGMSLVPLMEGRKVAWRDRFLYEYFREEWLPGIPLMLGVRTNDWTYCCYPDVDDIEELYDLKADPLQMRNLALVPEYEEKLKEMRSDLARLKKETAYPEGKQLGAPPVTSRGKPERVEGCVLFYDFAHGDVRDHSGHGNNGLLKGGTFVEEAGIKALMLQNGGYVDIPSSPSLNISMMPLTIEVSVKPDSPNGVIVAHGGESQGYSLYIEEWMPKFTVRANEVVTEIAGTSAIKGWVTLTAAIRENGISLYADGKEIAHSNATGLIPANPHENMQIGTDAGSQVGNYRTPAPFSGLMRYIRIWLGERKIEPSAGQP